jgi:hypothetical protein
VRAAGVAALVAFALLGAAVSRAATGHTYAIAGPLDSLSLSAAGKSVAIHAAVEDGCDQSGILWTPATGKAVKLTDACSNDASYESLTLAGSTAIWWDYDAGNHVYCTDVYVSGIVSPKPHGLNVCDGTAGDTYYEFAGDKTVTAVADYSVCEQDCTDANGNLLPDGDYGVEVGRVVGGKVVPILKPVDFRIFVDARNWRVATIEKNSLDVYDLRGKLLWSDYGKYGVSVGWIVGNTVVAQQDRRVMVFAPRSQRLAKTLPKGAKLAGVSGGLAVYTVQSSVHVLRLSDGRDRVLATIRGLADAQITPSGVFYGSIDKSYNGLVTFVPLADVLRRLHQSA